jgi:MYXO-CTERM domain-containing protein
MPALLLLLASAAGQAQSVVYGGRLDDPANSALVGSNLGAPSFVDAAAVANNVALYTLNVVSAGMVTIQSTGFAAGGIDPYFSLFKGAGDAATFVDSNYVQAFSTGGDFSYSAVLAAGAYRIAVGAFANMSYAENLGAGTLADGFTGLGSAAALGITLDSYRLQVSSPVPEPAGWWLLALGLPALRRLHRNRG